jgi:putative glutamine amidotransferase
MKLKLLLFTITALFLSNSFAGEARLLVWRPTPDSPAYILPQKSGETPQQAVERYRAFLFAGTGLAAVAPPTMFQNGEGEIVPLSESSEPRSLFVANYEKDHIDGSKRYRNFSSKITTTENFLLPLGALGRLSKAERAQIHEQVADKFAGLILMGGDDLDPKTYNEEVNGARGFNIDRDNLEIELIRAYVAAGKGFVFGICRGLQIVSAALGLKMKYQDIPSQADSNIQHGDNFHENYQRKTTNGLLERFLGGAQPFTGYSWHHQAVGYVKNAYLELAAVGLDGITEALEFLNGKGLLIQFHAELMKSIKGRKITDGVSQMIKSTHEARACRRTLLTQ